MRRPRVTYTPRWPWNRGSAASAGGRPTGRGDARARKEPSAYGTTFAHPLHGPLGAREPVIRPGEKSCVSPGRRTSIGPRGNADPTRGVRNAVPIYATRTRACSAPSAASRRAAGVVAARADVPVETV